MPAVSVAPGKLGGARGFSTRGPAELAECPNGDTALRAATSSEDRAKREGADQGINYPLAGCVRTSLRLWRFRGPERFCNRRLEAHPRIVMTANAPKGRDSDDGVESLP